MPHLASLVVVVAVAAITALLVDAASWTGTFTETAAFLTGGLLATVLAFAVDPPRAGASEDRPR